MAIVHKSSTPRLAVGARKETTHTVQDLVETQVCLCSACARHRNDVLRPTCPCLGVACYTSRSGRSSSFSDTFRSRRPSEATSSEFARTPNNVQSFTPDNLQSDSLSFAGTYHADNEYYVN